ncbi:MAG: patatin-like phospholipase family protein [Solirubrobacteraceae bacterium]
MAGPDTVALVLAGGGARGAYEMGALSVLLPELEQRGQRPRILVGTSVGALNASFLAAHAHDPVDELVPRALSIWEQVQWGEVAHGLISGPSAWRLIQYVRQVLGARGARLISLLDPEPLHTTLRGWVDFPRIAENVASGRVHAAGVVATSALTGRSVVFHHSAAGSPPADVRRGIDYVATPLGEAHVLASAAIPVAFPAVLVEQPAEARGWYWDGGTRLNTPIKPALALGATRIVVVALSSLAPAPAPAPAGPDRPDALEGVGQIMNGLFGDQLVADMQTLATINRMLLVAGGESAAARRIPYIAIAPPHRDTIALRAIEVVHAGGVSLGRHPDVGLLASIVGGGGDIGHADLLSFLLFTPEFARALIDQGCQDARRWLQTGHDLDELWQEGPLPAVSP